ncbi:MAG: MoaD/ThiS family protein [Acidobacteriota bacterium]|nr:MoaD/ThiS family protein [Acidobacteriota bacterium]MDH3785667.1 MoaD/ThiS family protein [Acidobacteriota bacterium]
MARVKFTQNLRRHLDVPEAVVTATTVREALDATFVDHPRLKSYIVDEQGRLRKHVVVFVDGDQVKDRARLGDSLRDDSEVFVMQALSGG